MNKLAFTRLQTVVSIVAISLLLIGSACNQSNKPKEITPEQQGKTIAIRTNKIHVNHYNSLISVYNTFIRECDTKHFATREEAQAYLDAKIAAIEDEYNAKIDAIAAEYDAAAAKYMANDANYDKFIDSYSIALDNDDKLREYKRKCEVMSDKCEQEAQQIRPANPNAERIIEDLVGEEYWEDCSTGYFPSCFQEIAIMEDSTSTVEITDASISDYHIVYYIALTNTNFRGATFYFDFKLTYTLSSDNANWYLDTIICNKIMPKITGKYSNAADVWYQDPILAPESLVVKNKTDAPIVVGVSYTYPNGEERKSAFCLGEYASAQEQTLFFGDNPEWSVDFVELM